MEITASKIDWLKNRKDFNTNPVAGAATRVLEHQYSKHADDLLPWVLREIRKGNIKLPSAYDESDPQTEGAWMKITKMEMAAEQELARRQQGLPPKPVYDDPWAEEGGVINQSDEWLQSTIDTLNKDLDAHLPYNHAPRTVWQQMHDANGGARLRMGSSTLPPEELGKWEEVLRDRAKRQKGVDPMQYSAQDLDKEVNMKWLPEYEDRQRQNLGQVVHKYPNGWTMRKVAPEEAEREGNDMGHCVGTEAYGYPEKMRNGETHIFSLRDPRNHPHTTLEIEPDRNNTEYSLDTNSYAGPWEGGYLTQVQGKENDEPAPQYKDMVRQWFAAMPEKYWPQNLEDDFRDGTALYGQYHPDQTPEAQFSQQTVANTKPGYPAMAHKNVKTGKVCHCPWGPKREVWEWHESALDPDLHNFTDTDNPPYEDWSDINEPDDDDDYSYIEPQSFQDVVDMFGGTGLVSNFQEKPGEVDISLVDVPEESRGQGTGSRFMEAAQKYCQEHGKQLVVSEVDNVPFFSKFPFLKYEPKQPGAARPRFVTAECVIPHHDLEQPCPVCHNPMVNGHCNQCEWSNLNPNIDSDPLSNPPDPTVDFHRGIQASIIPSHNWAKWYEASYDLENFGQ